MTLLMTSHTWTFYKKLQFTQSCRFYGWDCFAGCFWDFFKEKECVTFFG